MARVPTLAAAAAPFSADCRRVGLTGVITWFPPLRGQLSSAIHFRPKGIDPVASAADALVDRDALRDAGEAWIAQVDASLGVSVARVDAEIPMPGNPTDVVDALSVEEHLRRAAARLPLGTFDGADHLALSLRGQRPTAAAEISWSIGEAAIRSVVERVGAQRGADRADNARRALDELVHALATTLDAQSDMFRGAHTVVLHLRLTRPSAHARMRTAHEGAAPPHSA